MVVKRNWVGKGIYIIVIFVSISICILGMASNANKEQQQKVEHAKSTIKDEAVKIQRLDKQISQFYQKDQSEFLVEPIEEDELKDIERNITILKTEALDFGLDRKVLSADTSEVTKGKKELVDKVEDVKNKKALQNQVTALLVQAPNDWTIANGEAVIKDSTTLEQISKIRTTASKSKTEWSKAITSLLDEMETQVKQYKTMKQSIDMMGQEGTLTSNATIENVILIFNQLSEIKNESLKKDLSDKLDIIDKQLNKQEILESVSDQEVELSDQ